MKSCIGCKKCEWSRKDNEWHCHPCENCTIVIKPEWGENCDWWEEKFDYGKFIENIKQKSEIDMEDLFETISGGISYRFYLADKILDPIVFKSVDCYGEHMEFNEYETANSLYRICNASELVLANLLIMKDQDSDYELLYKLFTNKIDEITDPDVIMAKSIVERFDESVIKKAYSMVEKTYGS